MARLGPIWYHSELSDVPNSPNQFLDLDFFCHFLQQHCSSFKWDYKRIKFLFLYLFSVLFVSVLSFCVAGSIILSDNRRQLVNSVQLYQPSFLYAYLAIFLQGGVIQVRNYWNFISYSKVSIKRPVLLNVPDEIFSKVSIKQPVPSLYWLAYCLY